jgi:two-component system, OmpR family, sensor histidine kinase MprB
VAVAISAAGIYVLVKDQLLSGVDSALRIQARRVATSPYLVTPGFEPNQFFVHVPLPELGGPGGYIQLVTESGQVFRSGQEPDALPVTARTERVAAGKAHLFLSSAIVRGIHVRVLTAPAASGLAVQVVEPLTQMDREIGTIQTWLILGTLGGIGVAVLLGLVVTRAALAPVRRLIEAAEHVSATRDLRSRIVVRGRDELSRLASTFNGMMGALEQAALAQRQLIADASHELRTPLTSLRTNVQVLRMRFPPQSDDDVRLLDDVVEQIDEMASLVSDLVALARGDEQRTVTEEVDFRELVTEAVERASFHYPEVEFRTDLEASMIVGDQLLLQRAVQNLLDNAGKWSPSGGAVEVSLHGHELAVRDHGPGIDPEDLPHIFDRFYRATKARSQPGSGLGLAIVKQAIEAHAGTVTAEPADGGGTRFRAHLPLSHSAFYLDGSEQILAVQPSDGVEESAL